MKNLSLVMAEVECMANDPLPVAERAPRIAALERELDELHRVEEALAANPSRCIATSASPGLSKFEAEGLRIRVWRRRARN